ncbi:MAG: hypothetical protein RSC44_05230, partial [Clostridia bacterium]
NSFTTVNGKYDSGKSFGGLQVKWDLKELEKRLDQIAVKAADGSVLSYNYFEGIDANVTAYVGGNLFKAYTYMGADGKKYEYGFNGTGSKDPLYTSNTPGGETDYVAQAVSVHIKMDARVYSGIEGNALKFDPYEHATINNTAFGDTFKLYFGGSKPVNVKNTPGKEIIKVQAPFIKNTDKDGYSQLTDTKLLEQLEKDLSYKGYSKTTYFAQLTIGNALTGVQTVYVPINASSMTANVATVELKEKDVFNPYWYTEKGYDSLNVSFKELGSSRHNMLPVWYDAKGNPIKLEYFTNAAMTSKVNDITGGGTFYAKVPAEVVERESGKVIGSEWVKDGKPVDTGIPQTITLKIRVPILEITEVKFFDSNNLTG